MRKVKVTKIKTNIVDEHVPDMTVDNGEAGRHIETLLAKEGFRVDTAGPVDLIDYNTEVKSRLETSKASFTIGSMNVEDIKNTDYKNSPIYQKIQTVLIVTHDNKTVKKTETYDLTDPYIQDKIKEAYDYSKQQLINKEKISTKGYGYFEQIHDTDSYKFRISNSAIKKLFTMSGNSKPFNRLFE